jgi:hypothetical protein
MDNVQDCDSYINIPSSQNNELCESQARNVSRHKLPIAIQICVIRTSVLLSAVTKRGIWIRRSLTESE